jgi:hypothetical protein
LSKHPRAVIIASSPTHTLMLRLFLIPAAALALAGCATTNDSGVPLHPKPDLSAIAPGTPVDTIAALKKPVHKEPVADSGLPGAEVWLFEWDLPDDEVNNRMFTSVLVKDGLFVSFSEETADKWRQDPQQHMAAKLDSALEDVASLNATAARHQRVASMRENFNAAPYADTWDLLMERARFIRRQNLLAVGAGDQEAVSAEGQIAPAAMPNPEASLAAPAPAPVPVAGAPAVVQAAPPKKTLRELEAEELGIRADKSLTKKERMRRLREVWKLQREVMAGTKLAEN